jgi:diguanylate cyclase (GGDEF)-like protein
MIFRKNPRANDAIFDIERLDPSRYELHRDYTRRSALVKRLSVALTACLAVSGGLSIYFEDYEMAAFLLIIAALIASAVWVLKKTKSPTISGNWLLAVVGSLIFYTMLGVAGEVRAIQGWVAALPVLGTIVGKRKSGFVWFVLAALALLLSLSMGVTYAADETARLKTLVGHISFMLLCLFLTYVSFVYETYNAESLSFIRSLSARDELTKLFNRRGFLTMAEYLLALTRRAGKQFFIIFIDLNKFKQINDVHGHSEGDFALREVSHILKTAVRETDVAARLGGDEFAVAGSVVEPANVDLIVARLKSKLDERNVTSSKPYKVELSYGVTLDNPKRPVTLDELMASADALMYRQKRGDGAP